MRTSSSPRDSRSATSSGAVSQSLKVSAAAGVCAASCATSSEYAVTYPSAGRPCSEERITVRPNPRWETWIVSMGLVRIECHAPKRSRIKRLPWERAMGRSAAPTSFPIRAAETELPDRASASAQPTGPPPAMATSTSGNSSTADQRFDIPDRFRCRRRQHLAPGGRHHYVILDAHARIPELPGDVIGGTEVPARFHRQRHAGLEAPPFAPRLVLPGVVDIEPEPVPGAVHVEAFVILGLDHFFDSAATQAEIDEPSSECSHRRVVRFVPALARPHRRDRRGLRGEHQFVDVPLRAAEFSVYRKAARYVRGVAV